MRRRLAGALGALALGWLGSPLWAQEPPTSGLPQPTPVSVVAEAAGPMPTKSGVEAAKGSPEAAGTKVLAESSTTCCPQPGLFGNLFNHGCGGCDNGGHWTAGGGFYWMKPNFETNPAFRTTTAGVGLAPITVATVSRQQDFNYSAQVSPLAWIGYECASGLGVRGRWFNWDGNSNASFDGSSGLTVAGTPSPLGVTPIVTSSVALAIDGIAVGALGTLNAQSDLRVDVWDFEATKHIRNGPWDLLLSGGLRYVHMAQNYRANGDLTLAAAVPGLPALGLGTILTDTLTASHNFNGIGPTVSLESKRALGDTGLALYGNARGSVVFGTGRQRASRTQVATLGGITLAAVSEDNETSQDDVLSIGELEVGAEYGQTFGRFRAFVQAGFVGQVWLGGGNATNTAAFGGAVVGAPAASAVSGTESNNFGFIGGVFRLGISF